MHARADTTLQMLLEEWDNGVFVPSGGTTVAPLRVMEHPQLRELWRNQTLIRNHVGRLKRLVYALHRRVLGLPYQVRAAHKGETEVPTSKEAMTLEEAVAALQRIERAKRRVEEGGGISFLMNKLLPTFQQEPTPGDYEKELQAVGGDELLQRLFTRRSSEWRALPIVPPQ